MWRLRRDDRGGVTILTVVIAEVAPVPNTVVVGIGIGTRRVVAEVRATGIQAIALRCDDAVVAKAACACRLVKKDSCFTSWTRQRHVRHAVAVQVTNGHRCTRRAFGVGHGAVERSVTSSEQIRSAYGKVGQTIAVHIADRNTHTGALPAA